jgi:hypothetical protein
MGVLTERQHRLGLAAKKFVGCKPSFPVSLEIFLPLDSRATYQ